MRTQITSRLQTALAEALVLGLFEAEPHPAWVAAMGELGRQVGSRLALGDFTGKKLETAFVVLRATGRQPLRRIVLVGLGKRTEFTPERARQAAARGVTTARDLGVKSALLVPPGAPDEALEWAEAVRAAVLGSKLACYRMDRYRTRGHEDRPNLETVQLYVPAGRTDAGEAGLGAGEIVADAVNWARDLVNLPANVLHATALAETAREMAAAREDKGLTCRILEKRDLERLGFGCLLGVNRGSEHPPKFIILEYRGGTKGQAPVALVGKGVTFDTGGLCIKPSAGMDEMKTDMAGGAAVLATIRAIADLGVPVNVVGLVPTTDNMPSGSALRPGDVLTSHGGLTVEVVDTDAEGRLILADALAYADKEFAPAAIIDLATLTGSVIIALGSVATGLFTRAAHESGEQLRERIRAAGEAEGEHAWPLPTWVEYHDFVESDIADVKNADHRRGDAIAAAMFLSEFVGDRPWVHMDIAGTSWTDKDLPYHPKGATGAGIRTLVRLLSEWAEPEAGAKVRKTPVRKTAART